MSRLAAVLAALMIAVTGVMVPWRTQPAHASEFWCWDDPVVSIGGKIVSINLGVRQADVSSVSGAHIIIAVPEGVSTGIVFLEDTWFKPTVQFATYKPVGNKPPKGSFDIYVTVLLSASSSFDYKIQVVEGAGHGNDNRTFVAWANQLRQVQTRINGN